MGPYGYPRRGYRIYDKRFVNHKLGRLGLTKLALAKQNSRPVPRRDEISYEVNKPILHFYLLNFVKAVNLSNCGPVGLKPT